MSNQAQVVLTRYKNLALHGDAGELRYELESIYQKGDIKLALFFVVNAMVDRLALLTGRDPKEVHLAMLNSENNDPDKE